MGNNNNDDFWDESNRPSFEYFTFEEVGDRVRGIYVGKRMSINPYSEKKQEDYILDTEDGYVLVGGRAPLHKDNPDKEEKQVIYDMLDIPVGAEVGLVFDHKEEKKKGTAKIIEARYPGGEKDKEKVREFREKFDMGDDSSDKNVSLDDELVDDREAENAEGEEMPEF